MLLFHDGCFFQVVEGDADTIERIFATISRDARHSGVTTLESRAIDDRGFPQWSMGYVGAHALHPAKRDWLIGLSARVDTDDPAPLSEVARVNIHIESFLSTFREFARYGGLLPHSRYRRLILRNSCAPGTVLSRTSGDDGHETRDRTWLHASVRRLRGHASALLS